MIVDQIEAHFRGTPRGAAGNVSLADLRVLERLLAGREIGLSVETGSGASTILLGALSQRHIVFTEDDRAVPTSAVTGVLSCPIARPDDIEFVYGSVTRTLASHEIAAPIDLALLTGVHEHPSPAIEYGALSGRLTPGSAILVLCDVMLPHVRRLYDHLVAGDAFVLVGLAGAMAFFRRTEAPLGAELPADWADRPLPPDSVRLADAAEAARFAADAVRHGTTDAERAQLSSNHGAAVFATGDLEAAETSFRAALAKQPDHAEAFAGLAGIAIARETPASALPLRRWASLLDPNRVSLRLDLAQDLLRLRRVAEAEAVLLDILRWAPGHRSTLDLLADLTTVLGRTEDAEACRAHIRLDGPEGPLPVYAPGTRLDFTAWGDAGRFLGRGWNDGESWGRWARGGEATLEFRLDGNDDGPGPGTLATIELDAGASYADASFRPIVELSVNGRLIATQPLAAIAEINGPARYAISFDSTVFQAGCANTIGFAYRTALVPLLVSGNGDSRVLGLALAGLRLSFQAATTA